MAIIETNELHCPADVDFLHIGEPEAVNITYERHTGQRVHKAHRTENFSPSENITFEGASTEHKTRAALEERAIFPQPVHITVSLFRHGMTRVP